MDHKIEVCNSNFDFFNKKKPENIINTEGIAKIKEQFIIKIITKIKEIKEIKGVEGVEGVEVIEKFEEVEEVDELKRFDLYNRLRTFLFDFYLFKILFNFIILSFCKSYHFPAAHEALIFNFLVFVYNKHYSTN